MPDGRLLLVVPSGTSFLAFFQEVAVAWRDSGRAVAVATSAELPGATAAGWPAGVERLHLPDLRGGSPMRLTTAARVLGAHVRSWRPSLAHAHFTAAATALAVTGLPAGVARLATFHGMHMSSRPGSGSLLASLAERLAIRRMDHVWVLNAEDEEFLRRCGLGSRVSRLAAFGVGCDLERFDPNRFTASGRQAMRESLGISQDADVVAFVGRRTAFKGFATTVRAFQLIRSARPAARLLLLGAGDRLHASGLTAAEARDLENDPAVVDLGWQQDVSPALSIADLVVFPSTREGMPVNLMEALAMGVPVVASQTRGCRDIVDHGLNGVLVERCTVHDIAEAAVRLLVDRLLREEMARTAFLSRQRFDRRSFMDAQLDAYETMLSSITCS